MTKEELRQWIIEFAKAPAYPEVIDAIDIRIEFVIAQAIAEHEAFNFNKIIDIRNYLLRHPDQDMIKAACLHYLGDSYNEQKQWKSRPPFVPGSPSYLCQMKDGRMVVKPGCNSSANWNDVIAFRELPAPYQPTEEGGER